MCVVPHGARIQKKDILMDFSNVNGELMNDISSPLAFGNNNNNYLI